MKKLLILLSAAVLALGFAACEQLPKLATITIQLKADGAAFAQADVPVTVLSTSGTKFESKTDVTGEASFLLPMGTYSASVTYKTASGGVSVTYNGSNSNVVAAVNGTTSYTIDLNRVENQQIVIKELYFGGCTNPSTSKGYSDDAYVILYNNSELEADASEIVFSFVAPYNGNGTNKYYTDGKLKYESDTWIPAYGAIWWFQSPVKIPAYSQIVVAIFGAIDHTATVSTSVNLADPSYYWMSNSGIAAYTAKKYAAADVIPAANYLTTVPISQGTAWTMSNSSPGFYIGRMASADAKSLSENVDAFDTTLGTTKPFYVAKFPKANVVDAVEVWSTANIAKSQVRFSADINTGYVGITNNKGYTVYRNVDKEATEALAENAGKLVYDYAGGTADVDGGSTDPSGIDAEASIAAGAHIIYSETNDSSKDFHQRKVATLKK